MPTVMLTTHCPNACPWCFAGPKMEEYRARGIREMSWDDFLAVVDFHERSGLRVMVLLGGEPALHSRFLDILKYLHQRGFSALVATTGILPGPLVDEMASENLPGLEFAVNSTPYSQYPEDKKRKVDDFLGALGRSTSIGYTLTERDAVEKRIEPILDRIAMIMKFGLRRKILFQIAVPGKRNHLFVPFERYRDAAELLVAWFRILRRNGISGGLDCHCMPACEIPPKQRGTDFFSSRCDPFMIDIGPGLDVWPCFPLSEQQVKLTAFHDLRQVQEHFATVHRASRLLYDERCEDCAERFSGACDGGCRGFQHLRRPSSGRIAGGEDGPRDPGAHTPQFRMDFEKRGIARRRRTEAAG